ncbi:MAG: hydrogenase maturation protease [Desulfobulbaceae bacterium]|nr:hydrogenase maturation protease [Desulfobulbaceae bacterium]
MKGAIICIGNRLVAEDAAGMAVFDQLRARDGLPAEVTVIEGGLAGLNLLPLLEQGGRVVFVDAVQGFTRPGEMVLLDRQQIVNTLGGGYFDHGSGLAYVLSVLPQVCDGDLPEEIVLVGLEGECTLPTIKRAAELSITLATHGLKERT